MSLHRPDRTPRKSKSAIGRITVANRVNKSASPARLARRKATITPRDKLMKTKGCPILETHRAKTTTDLGSTLLLFTRHFEWLRGPELNDRFYKLPSR